MMKLTITPLVLWLFTAGAHAQYAMSPWPPGSPNNPNGKAAVSSTPVPAAAVPPGAPAPGTGEPTKYGQAQKENQNKAQSAGSQMPQMPQMPMGGGAGGGRGLASGGDDGLGGQMPIKSCEGNQPDPTALQTAIDCSNQKLSAGAGCDRLAMADTDGKIMFIVDRNTKQPVGCVQISTGSGGTGSAKGQTPLGMLITGPHDGEKYQSYATGTNHDCVGLQGTDGETRTRAENGVVIHPAHGGAGRNSTAGCIGVEDSQFAAVKAAIYGSDSAPKHCPVFIFDHNTREHCSPSSSGGGGSGGSDEQSNGVHK